MEPLSACFIAKFIVPMIMPGVVGLAVALGAEIADGLEVRGRRVGGQQAAAQPQGEREGEEFHGVSWLEGWIAGYLAAVPMQ